MLDSMNDTVRAAEPDTMHGDDADEILTLPEVLDLGAAALLQAALLRRRGHAVAVDAAAVGRMGGQCLQVLLAARASWAADGHALTICEPSAAFVDAAHVMGATAALGVTWNGAN